MSFPSYFLQHLYTILSCLQVYLHYIRQSTDGWAVQSVFCDMLAGILCFLQMITDAFNNGELPTRAIWTIHIHFEIRVLPVSHWMRLARWGMWEPVLNTNCFSTICLLSSKYTSDFMADDALGWLSLWPSDAIWWQGSGSTLVQVMACCLTAPSHYLNQCWLFISKVQWHSSGSSSTKETSPVNQ